ncbi:MULTISPECIES: hypothetical protein [Nostocales]|uniref:Uncharacterized protein n=3 Tax=Nostocales TaxID=1161 RepID=A0A0C1N5C9_9CYAN|nr:hypothetical protein [Tolypothrix bouteillei]KAF3888822.1 hypothetical protein DA73_0400027560 [Tolypothrix bouteillei VB521301]
MDRVSIFLNNYSRLTIELVGEKGTAIIQQFCYTLGCSAPDPYGIKQPLVRVYLPSGIKNLEYFEICSLKNDKK